MGQNVNLKSKAKAAREQRMAELARLYLRYGEGWRHEDYARALGLARPTISLYMKSLCDQWRASALCDTDTAKRRLLASYAHRRQEAWDAWEKSKEKAIETRREGMLDPNTGAMKGRKATISERSQTGDPRYLQIIAECDAQERAVLGLDADRAANRMADAMERQARASEQAARNKLREALLSDPALVSRLLGHRAHAPVPAGPGDDDGAGDDGDGLNGNGGGNGHGGNGGNGHPAGGLDAAH